MTSGGQNMAHERPNYDAQRGISGRVLFVAVLVLYTVASVRAPPSLL
jgi:hypothetical protein